MGFISSLNKVRLGKNIRNHRFLQPHVNMSSVSNTNVITRRIAYGDSDDQYFNLNIPNNKHINSSSRIPIAFIIHGGYWQKKYAVGTACIESVTPFLIEHGIATVDVEYRRIDTNQESKVGIFPQPNEDITNAMLKLDEIVKIENNSLSKLSVPFELDINQLFVIGHSIGGYLALWSCLDMSLKKLPFTPAACLALAPVGDLVEAEKRKFSPMVNQFVNLPLDESEENSLIAFQNASPSYNLPFNIPLLIVNGLLDNDVPPDSIKTLYQTMISTTSPKQKELTCNVPSIHYMELPECDHYAMCNTSSKDWNEIFRRFVDLNFVKNLKC